MSSQGPTIVNTGVDAGDNGNAWTNTGSVTLNDGTSYAQCTISSGTSNTLKCKFNVGAFTITTLEIISDISISFKALHGQGSGNVSSVKISLGTTDKGDNAALGSTVNTFTYDGILWGAGSISPTAVNGAWEIDLVFSGPGTIEVQDVTATVTYVLAADVFFLFSSARKASISRRLREKIVDRIRQIIKVIPFTSFITNNVPVPVPKLRTVQVTRTQKVKASIVAVPPPEPAMLLVRSPRAYYVSRPQLKNRPAQVTSIQNNYVFFRPHIRQVPVFRQVARVVGNLPWLSYTPITIRQSRQVQVPRMVHKTTRFLMPTEVIQPMLVQRPRPRMYGVPYSVRPMVRRMFSSTTNVTQSITNVIAPAKKPRGFPVPYSIVRRVASLIAASPVVMARKVASVRQPLVVRRHPNVLVASTVYQAIPLIARRSRPFVVSVPGKRVVHGLFESITVNPLVLKRPAATRQIERLSVIRRRQAVTVANVAPVVVRQAQLRAFVKTTPPRRVASVLVSGLQQVFVSLVVRRKVPFALPRAPQKVSRAVLQSTTVTPMVVNTRRMPRFVPVPVPAVRGRAIPLVRPAPVIVRPRQPRPFVVSGPVRRMASAIVSGLQQVFVPLPTIRRRQVSPPAISHKLVRTVLQSATVQPLAVVKVRSVRTLVTPLVVRRIAPLVVVRNPAVLSTIRRQVVVNTIHKRTNRATFAGKQPTVIRSVRRQAVPSISHRKTASPVFVSPQPLVISPVRQRLVRSLYPAVQKHVAPLSPAVTQQNVMVARVRQRTSVSFYPKGRHAANSLFGQNVMIRSPRVVR